MTVKITAALVCLPTAPASPDREDWRAAPGGPLHPLGRLVLAEKFPLELTLAIHVRVQGTGALQLVVSMFDGAGRHVTWGRNRTDPILLDLPIWEQVGESADTLTLPRVKFPCAGRYTVQVVLRREGPVLQDRDEVELPLDLVVAPAPQQAPDGPSGLVSLVALLADLQTRLAPETLRALRLAADEARRLGARHIGTEHLLIGLRRVIGRRSGLPHTNLLRDALEQRRGLFAVRPRPGDLAVSPDVAHFLHDATATGAGLEAEALLKGLASLDASCRALIVESYLRSEQRPR